MDREDDVPNNETSLTKMLKMALLYRAMKKTAAMTCWLDATWGGAPPLFVPTHHCRREFGIKKKTVLMPGGLRLLFLKESSSNELRAAFCFSSTRHFSAQFRRHASAVLSSNLILTLKSKRHQQHIWGRLFRDYLRFARRTNWTIKRGCMWFTRLMDVIIQFIRMYTKHRFARRTNWTKEGLHAVSSIDRCNNSVYGGCLTIFTRCW